MHLQDPLLQQGKDISQSYRDGALISSSRIPPQKCDQKCIPDGNGSGTCACFAGYELRGREGGPQQTCEDVDECRRWGECSHDCHNLPGNRTCTCRRGYELASDGRTCLAKDPHKTLIFSTTSEVSFVRPFANCPHLCPSRYARWIWSATPAC